MPSIECRTMPFEKALRIFRKKCEKANVVGEVRERQYYEKPTSKRKRKKSIAVRKQKKLHQEMMLPTQRRPAWQTPKVKSKRRR